MIYDITLTLSETLPVWPGDPQPHFKKVLKLEEGEIANVTHISMGAHTGTHVDAPSHFLKEGSSVEDLSLDTLIGKAFVIEIEGDLITKEALKKASIPQNVECLLLKTRNSNHWTNNSPHFDENFVAIAPDGAEYLVERGVKLIGVDYLSVAPFKDPTPTHQILLKASTIIVEGLNLSEIDSGEYTLYCLPLKIAGSDGAPARTILIKNM